MLAPRHREQQLLRRDGREDLAEAAQLDRDDDDGGEGGDVDQDVLDDRRSRPARAGRSNR